MVLRFRFVPGFRHDARTGRCLPRKCHWEDDGKIERLVTRAVIAPPITALNTADTVLHLPPPPSVNATRRDYGKGTAALHKWHQLADKQVLAAGGTRRLPRIPDRFQVTVTLDERHCPLDLDNGIKALLDYARRIELVRDDSPRYLRRLVVEWGTVPTSCELRLTPVSS